jgi:phosphopantothenoylcysteine decarboxylase/phosphopantothenate--cysteine ligase
VNILISCGPTREYIDAVRFISNASSGRMGRELARAALRRHCSVRVVAGPVEVALPAGAKIENVLTALEMRAAMLKNLRWADVIFMAAAVSDWRPAKTLRQKLKKSAGPPKIRLVKNPDILAELGARKGGRVLVGFAVESKNLLSNSTGKLAKKRCDFIVANPPESIGADAGAAYIIGKTGIIRSLQKASKTAIAEIALEIALDFSRGRSRKSTRP